MCKNFEIELLSNDHTRNGFDCGEVALNKYIKSSVDLDIKKYLTRCYVSIEENNNIIIGYYTLSNHAIAIDTLPKSRSRKIPPGYSSVGTILLGRLAIDLNYQNLGLGKYLLVDSIKRSLSAARISQAYAIITHAKNETAAKFYEHYGFLPLRDNKQHLYLPMKTAEKIFTD